MARTNRRDLFNPGEVSVLHCCQRAVLRAMLCGQDPVLGKNYEHRREWIRDRLEFLAGARQGPSSHLTAAGRLG
jgi:hypothetical protein